MNRIFLSLLDSRFRGNDGGTERNTVFLLMVLLVLLVAFLVGCAGFMQQTGDLKSIDDMTPKERATWFTSVYNSQDRDYRAMVARSDLTTEQKHILRKKKAIMTQLYPMIQTYNLYIESGAVPTKEVEDRIIEMINNLTSLVLPLLEQ